MTFLQFVGRLDGEGAFAVVETNDPADILDASAKFAPPKMFSIYPVIDMAEWAQKLQEGVDSESQSAEVRFVAKEDPASSGRYPRV